MIYPNSVKISRTDSVSLRGRMAVVAIQLVLMSHAYCQAPNSTYELTADEIECNQKTDQCVARKNARVVTGPKGRAKILRAEVMVASQTPVQTIDAKGQVLLEAQEDTIQLIQADQAHYEPDNQKATFMGNVRLRFRTHILRGGKATADLRQGNFTLKSDQQNPVRGLIYLDALAKSRHRT